MNNLNNIPQQRLILYIIFLGLLPVTIVGMFVLTNINELSLLRDNLLYVSQQASAIESKNRLNVAVREHFKNANHYYIDQNLETLVFLQDEIEALNKVVNNKYFAGDETVKKRLEFLSGKENTMIFSEGNIESYPFFQETVLSLSRPVEVNLDNIKQILAIVEGQPIGNYKSAENRPQLIILDFKIDKKETSKDNEVFNLNMKILNREYQ